MTLYGGNTYRWWTVFPFRYMAWSDDTDRWECEGYGIKLGPLTVDIYRSWISDDRWVLELHWLNRLVWESRKVML